jgi:hypothetical protein
VATIPIGRSARYRGNMADRLNFLKTTITRKIFGKIKKYET